MLSFSADAINEMQRDGAVPVFELNIGAPVNEDIELMASRIPVLRSSTRPLSRTFELSTLSLQMDNLPILPGRLDSGAPAGFRPGFWFSEWDEFSILNSGGTPLKWHKAPITVKMGVRLPSGETETQTVFTSLLVDVNVRMDAGLAELVCIDPLARLRQNTINSELIHRDPDDTPDSGDETGRDYRNYSSALVVLDLLKAAGFTSSLRLSTFNQGIFEEATEGFLQNQLQLGKGTWWSAISRQLDVSNAGLRWNVDGELEYFKFRPEPSTASVAYVFQEGRNLVSVDVRRPDTAVVNSVTVTRLNSSGVVVETLASPIQDTGSITDHDERGEDVVTDFLSDFPADQVASERMFFKSEPFRILNVRGAWDSFRVEIGDVVQVDARKTAGLEGQIGTVFSKAINPSGGVSFQVMDTILTQEPYLFADNSQNMDSGQKVW